MLGPRGVAVERVRRMGRVGRSGRRGSGPRSR